MPEGLLGRKVGMTAIFVEDGKQVPVTVIDTRGNKVVAKRTEGENGYNAVVIGFDLTLAYTRVCRAAWWIEKGKPWFATNPDRVCPTDQPTVLVDCGAICAMLAHATGRTPDRVFGKPDPTMLSGILARHGLHAGEIAMVGDRIYTDILTARNAGALGILVLTGEATAADAAAASPPPPLVLPSLAELGDLLAASQASPVVRP